MLRDYVACNLVVTASPAKSRGLDIVRDQEIQRSNCGGGLLRRGARFNDALAVEPGENAGFRSFQNTVRERAILPRDAAGERQGANQFRDCRTRGRGFGFDGGDYRHLAAAMVTLVGLLMLGYIAWALHRRQRGDALDRQWRRFCRRLSRAGTCRADWQGPLDFADQAAGRHPSRADDIRWIGARYAELRYGRNPPTRRDLADLETRIRHLDIP